MHHHYFSRHQKEFLLVQNRQFPSRVIGMDGGGEEEAEALALRSLLDEYEAIEVLGCLSPLGDSLEPLGNGAAERQLASDGDNAAARVTTSSPDDAAKRANSTRPSTKRADSNRARNERRFEVVHLRRQASELEGQLEEIRHKEKRRWRPLAIDTGGVYPGRESLQLTHPSVPRLVPRPDETWMEAAEEQRAKRQRAETDNTRLRLLVSDHLKTTAKLKRLLMPKRTRYALQGLGVHIDDSKHDKEATTDTPAASETTVQAESTVLVLAPTVFATTFGIGSAMDTAQVFDMLTRSLDRARSNLDAVFAANGLAGTEKTYRRAKVEQDEANGTVMELVSNKLLPYTMEATQSVAWRHFRDSLPQMPDRAFFKYRDPRKVRLSLSRPPVLTLMMTRGRNADGGVQRCR